MGMMLSTPKEDTMTSTTMIQCSGCGGMFPITELDLGEDFAACSDECLEKIDRDDRYDAASGQPEITLDARENDTITQWIRDSRSRYGAAYFISTYDGITLWKSNRPYGTNDRLATLDAIPTTWAELDKIIYA